MNCQKKITLKGTDVIADLFGDKRIFNYSKPVDLMQEVLERISNKDSIILDSFAGSGTPAHAVLNMNRKDGGNRSFILIEMMDCAESITAERVKRVIKNHTEIELAVTEFRRSMK